MSIIKLMKKIPTLVYFFLFLICSASAGFYIGKWSELSSIRKEFYSIRQIRFPNDKYPLVSRLIGVELPNATDLDIYTDLYNKIKDYTNEQISTKPITKFSFYFRDLNTGLWFGLNQDQEYVPASLFKLPIAITYYKDDSSENNLLDQYLTYTKEIDNKLDTQIGLQKSELVVDESYTIRELIDKMLIDSDNGAKNLLTEHINVKTMNTLFNLIQLDGPAQNNYYISPKEYAFILRILYNGSYLGQEKSQILLTRLTQTTFNQGIRKSIPGDILVAHKFGSVNLIDKDTHQKQIGFHDCGVIYYPQKPFVLCIMSSGNDQPTLVATAEKVTSLILSYIQDN